MRGTRRQSGREDTPKQRGNEEWEMGGGQGQADKRDKRDRLDVEVYLPNGTREVVPIARHPFVCRACRVPDAVLPATRATRC